MYAFDLVATWMPSSLIFLRFFGVLLSHSSLRGEVVPAHPYDLVQRRPPAACGHQLSLPTPAATTPRATTDPTQSLGLASGSCFSRRSRHVPPLRRAYALARDCAHSALYRPALGRARRGSPTSTPRAPTLVEPAHSTVRALTLPPSRMTARSKTSRAGRLP